MIDKRAYTEAFYIINMMSDELKNKIPDEIIKNIESKMDKNYEFSIDDDIEEAELLEDTEKILSVLYTDYLATDEERIVIKNKENMLKQTNQIELPDVEIHDIFPVKPKINMEEHTELIELPKKKWYTVIVSVFKKIWNKLMK